jgi:hypothetical protein
MAILMLRSLVLRGSVRQDALGYLRLGRGVEAGGEVPGIINSRQPLPGKRPAKASGQVPNVVVDTTQGTCPGAGRSRRFAGSSLCQGFALSTATRWWHPTMGIAAARLTGREERSR